jgi:chloramphenicol-sensitive protein RarD
MSKGSWYAVGAYIIWGILPVYWKSLHHVPAPQLLSHRIVWSFLLLIIVILLSRRWDAFRVQILKPRVLRVYIVAALLLSINWLIYIWAVNAGYIVETSLGYFINPLISVLMGVIFFREHLRPAQWIPIGLAGIGVIYLTIVHGSLPWIALCLAFSFGTYGLVKKIAPLGSLHGLTLETGILLVPALVYLIYSEMIGQGAFLRTGAVPDGLLVGAGLMTTVPLLMFSSAARRIPLFLIGVLQYIAPTLQFLLGVLVYKEPFTITMFVGFGIVWAALMLFGVEGFITYRLQSAAAVAD